jgi:hypothetical protein
MENFITLHRPFQVLLQPATQALLPSSTHAYQFAKQLCLHPDWLAGS